MNFSLLESTEEIPEAITKLALDRVDAKIAKNWQVADRIRDELMNK
jgi:cysteinyl-tRNA synthetase